MFVKRSPKGKPHFVFHKNTDNDAYINNGGGESKTHHLIKLALCEIESTTLKVKGLLADKEIYEEKVYFKNIKDEVHFNHGESNYFIDTFGEFESGGILHEKWDGKIGIEVFHKHKLEGIKIAALRKLDLPIVEFKVPKIRHYWGPEDEPDEKQENRYIAYAKKVLSDYMWVKVISNPNSKSYLTKINRSLINQLQEQKSRYDETNDSYYQLQIMYDRAKKETQNLEDDIARFTSECDDQSRQIRSLQTQLATLKATGVLKFILLKMLGRL